MPELPEVETVATGVHARIAGERIEAVWLGSKPEPFKTEPLAMAEALTGARIRQVRRVGKHIVFDLLAGSDAPGDLSAALGVNQSADGPADGPADRPADGQADGPADRPADGRATAVQWSLQWIVHLGMTGRLLVVDAAVPRPAHTHAALSLSSGRELRFVDARRFGRLALLRTELSNEQAIAPGFKGPGQEPLSISFDDFAMLFRGRKLAIKAALLNQALLHGVGNIYADESLFRAGIRPTTPAGRLSRARLHRLCTALRTVLESAIALGGSSVSDYVDAAGVRGFFQLEHKVYARTGQPCLVCGMPIRRAIVGGRSTHSCPQCQR